MRSAAQPGSRAKRERRRPYPFAKVTVQLHAWLCASPLANSSGAAGAPAGGDNGQFPGNSAADAAPAGEAVQGRLPANRCSALNRLSRLGAEVRQQAPAREHSWMRQYAFSF